MPGLRVGILGAGTMGTAHAAAYRTLTGVEIAGIFSRDRNRAASAARDFGTRPIAAPDALIDDPDIDAIDVCLPTHCHAEFVIAALARGKHVFCETPFAPALAAAEVMIAAARQANKLLLVGLLLRAIAEYQFLHDKVASGEHGRLLSLTTHRLGSYLRPDAPDHKSHYSDPTTELMTFDFDCTNWLLGAPVRLSAAATNGMTGQPGEVAALLQYADGRQATVLASGMLPKSFAFKAGLRALFEGGAYELETVFDRVPPTTTFQFYPEDGPPQPVAVAGHNPYAWELSHFIDSIRGNADRGLLDPRHALAALKLSLATQQSLRERQVVELI
jgi:predicted dehydrogenase